MTIRIAHFIFGISLILSFGSKQETLAQSAGDFRSRQSGEWGDANTWERFDGVDWESPAPYTPTSADGVITIMDTHIVTVTSNVSADQIEWDNSSPFGGLSGQIIVGPGAVLTIDNGPGDDVRIINDFANVGILQVEGSLFLNTGATIVNDDYGNLGIGPEPVSPDTYKVTSGGTHIHTTGAGVSPIPNADWQSGSICQINATGLGVPSIDPGISFHHFVWNGSSQSTTLNLVGQLLSVNGDFIVTSTNGQLLQLSTMTAYTLNILRDFIVQGNSRVQLVLSGSPTTINIGRNFEIASTSAASNAISFNATSSLTINISGNFSKSNNATAALCIGGGVTVMNLLGNFTLTGGTLTSTNTNGSATINFNGTSTSTFTNSGTISNSVNFTVASTKTLDLGTSAITGTGNFTLNGTIRVGSTDPGGALQLSPATSGNIQVGGIRTYAANSTIEYNGSGAQFIGNGFPPSGDVNLRINNSNGVTLSDDLEIVALRLLTLQSGNLVIGNQTLTINGTVTGSGGLIGGPTSNVIIGGTGNFGTLTFNGTNELLNFTINRTGSGVVTLGGDLTILGTLTQTAGDIVLNGNTLTISGGFSRSAGTIVGSGTSSLIINGSGVLPISVGLSGSSLQTLTLNRNGATLTLPASVTITNLNLLDGTLDILGVQIANGGTITRDGGSMTQPPGGSNSYNLVYTTSGAINTGPEFHSNVTRVNNVEMNGGGSVTLAGNRTINGNLTLTSGDFNIGSNTLTLEGDLIANSSSTFTGGTVVFDGNTTISGSAIPTFGNIQVNDTRSLTFPSGDFDVAGDVFFEAGAIINSGTGTLVLSGGAPQIVSGGGVSIANIRIEKTSGADVELTSGLVVTGTLQIASANTNLESNGNLVIRSTSDGTLGNGRIAPLLNGASISGDVTVERYMAEEGRIYRYISAPVSGFTVADLQDYFPITGSFTGADNDCAGCTSNQSMFSYNGTTQAYEDFPVSSNTETLTPGVGYSAFIRQNIIGSPVTIEWTGPVNQGTVSLPVSYNGTPEESWNLVGNPFPSSIDWDISGWTKVRVANDIAVRDNATGMLRVWNGSVGNLLGGVIATGQAFWVRATGASPNLQVSEAAKTSTGQFFRESSDELNQFILTLSDGTVEDQAFYWVSDEALAGLDDYDAIKLNNFRDVGSVPLMDLATYSYDENPLPMAINSVNRVNCGDIVRVYTNDLIEGNYEFSFETSGFISDLTWILKDKFTGSQTNLSQNPVYNFVVTADEASKAVDRFELSIAYTPVELTTHGNTLISSYETGNQWYLNGMLLEGETDQELHATESGLYTLEVNVNGCISTTDRQFVVTDLENPIERTIRVFPNPVKDVFTLEVDSEEPVRARLFNTMGVEVTWIEMNGSALTKHAEFDMSNHSNGMYILHVQKGGRVHQVKIIKTNK